MKRVVVSITNRVFADSVMLSMRQTGDFRPVRIPFGEPEAFLAECTAAQPELLLMEVTGAPGDAGLETRLELIARVRRELPGCRAALLCDETAYPELAREVMRARQAGRIDAFFYASVTAGYLLAALDAL